MALGKRMAAAALQTRYSTKTCSKTLRHKSTNLTKALSHVPVYEGGFISWMQVHSFQITIGLRKSGPPNLQFSSDKCFSNSIIFIFLIFISNIYLL
jgi:hypothetical protein